MDSVFARPDFGAEFHGDAGVARADARPRLVDTTMLYAPRSGGVKRYLDTKRDWMRRRRPDVRHTLVVPGERHGWDAQGRLSIYAAPLPFGDGYRWPALSKAWARRLIAERPDLIEAGDVYTPGRAAQLAGQALGAPVVGFCHTDLAALAALHIGEWAEAPVRRRWAEAYRRFDRVLTPSRFMADRLAEAGVGKAVALPLGVDETVFRPHAGAGEALRRRLGLNARHRLLVFAGRPAREKRVDVLTAATELLGDPYVLILIGAGEGAQAGVNTVGLPYEPDPQSLAFLLSGCDAFVHANDAEPFGLVVLEALACGLPVVGVASGGVAETVDHGVGELADASTPAAIAEAVRGLFDRDLTALRAAARARAEARHTWETVFAALTDHYAALTGEAAFLREPADAAA